VSNEPSRAKLTAYATPGGAGVQHSRSVNHTENNAVRQLDAQDKPTEHLGEDPDPELLDWALSLSLLPDSGSGATGPPPDPLSTTPSTTGEPGSTGERSHPGATALTDPTETDTPADTDVIGIEVTGTDAAVVRGRRARIGRRRGTRVVAALVLLTVVVLGLGGICIAQVVQDHHLDSMRISAIVVAERQTMNLMNVNSANVGSQLDAIRGGTTGEFQRQLFGVQDTFSKVIQQGKIDSTGRVVKAAITSLTPDTAKVLLAVSGTVANAESPQPQQRRYRIGVDLKYSDGNWLVSGMEFIP